MRIAFVSDIHGNLAALQAIMKDIRRHQPDAVINLGDTLSGPLLPQETAELLRQLDWHHVGGNHERQVLSLPLNRQNQSDAFTSAAIDEDTKAWIGSHANPGDKRLHEGRRWADRLGPDVALCHGSPRSDIEYLLETPVGEVALLATSAEIEERLDSRLGPHITLLACGHTHVPRSVRTPSGLLIVNPGSVGLPAYDDDHPLPQSSYHRIENGSPDARYAMVEKASGQWRCELISVAYDFHSMAEVADRNGRPDWAHALRTGFMPRV
ncbi:metallophosphoesterase family protein [Hydrogenophaga sp. PAMC20947]|uniref:metallophosphoesterase family protein n=1 Tax=Hydrogenophaga sp. PAMC20947 TaxID=2565558 RepID=UPI00109DD16E|nr:metallophosphoesterase family protein [Hydrogenophaga sp. PAMC20947]QCB48167.1 metallophosphoesterase [Hydrogenophaga sp. PAMC20947]